MSSQIIENDCQRRKEHLQRQLAFGGVVVVLIWAWLLASEVRFAEVTMEVLFVVGPAVLTVIALWRWRRDAYKHVTTPWRRSALIIGLAANLLAQSIFWGGNLFFWAYSLSWSPEVGEIVQRWWIADTALCAVALTGSIIGDGDGRFALGAASVWLASIWVKAAGAIL